MSLEEGLRDGWPLALQVGRRVERWLISGVALGRRLGQRIHCVRFEYPETTSRHWTGRPAMRTSGRRLKTNDSDNEAKRRFTVGVISTQLNA